MTTTIGTHSTRRQRHESASGRLAVLAGVLNAFDLHIAGLSPGAIGLVDRPALRRIVRALLPLALDDPTFDVTSTVGPSGVAVRIHHCAEQGLTARIVSAPGVPVPEPRPAEPSTAEPVGSHVVGELAELLRQRQARPR